MKTLNSLLIFTLLQLFSINTFGQSLILNPYFDDGDETRLQCSYDGQGDVTNLVTGWQPAYGMYHKDPDYSLDTYDWLKPFFHSTCPINNPWKNVTGPSDKFIHRFDREAMLGTLQTTLSSTSQYVFRIKIKNSYPDKICTVKIGYCSSTELKGTDGRPKRVVNDYWQPTWFTIPANAPQEWYTFQHVITPPSNFDGKLSKVLIDYYVGSSTHSTSMFIDEVELFEYCPDYQLIQNRQYV
ncbi:MAG: hypothetical protein M3Q97_02835 [Bacteroidota bacterium]|nr:hypothetical protein [Bacteroidota bacterium]